MSLPAGLKPGTFFVSHGTGVLGSVIRHATESWAGHAGEYIGEYNFSLNGHDVAPAIVEARWPQVKVSRASRYPDAHWAVGEPLTDAQRDLIVARARQLCGDRYDLPAYGAFALELLHVVAAKDLVPLMSHDTWRVCSAVVADTRLAAGIRYWPGAPVNCVSPADLFNLAVTEGWF